MSCSRSIDPLIIWTATDPLISIFNSENNVQLLNYAHTGLRLYFLGFIVAGINVVLVAYFSAVDELKIAIVGSFLRGIVAIVICAVILAKLFGLNGIWTVTSQKVISRDLYHFWLEELPM